ncbi:pectinesterase family protein [Flavobacterium gilvum]|uniref:Pectinesterase n=1 Tax=Flavobacterium gilvum TaxID=1492737 RepID=A0AAC9N7N9_9FLAO|nr:pectinesterase family protein [Flavobacterium gilvum]AOW11204.1 pectin esterase [Flavobacterium gilvum]KFC58612.1 pectinesterase [Flavobacterium gilvum]
MKYILILLLAVSPLIVSAQTIDNRFELTVAQDGSGDFKTIQEAINTVRDHAEIRVIISIKPGVYNEKVVIPSFKRNITLKGLDKEKTIISYDDYSGKPFRGIDVTGNPKFSTYTSYTLLVQGNDCLIENLIIENTAGRVGQAVALHTEGDRVAVKNCSILGNQDTLYLAKGGTRNYFENCFINGTVDFIFGAATAYFYNCTIESLSNAYVTAASTTKEDLYGFVFVDCKLTAKDKTVDKVFLGRPWRPYAKTVIINTEMGTHIVPEGWNPWAGDKNFPDKEKTVYYAEYSSKGEGAKDLSKRAVWSHQLKKSERNKYNLDKVLSGWNPSL